MLNRSRDYYRKMRAKHIRRKKRITARYDACRGGSPYYEHDGEFSKNKIHCSCPLCKDKAYYGKHMPTVREKRMDDALNARVQDAQDA